MDTLKHGPLVNNSVIMFYAWDSLISAWRFAFVSMLEGSQGKYQEEILFSWTSSMPLEHIAYVILDQILMDFKALV